MIFLNIKKFVFFLKQKAKKISKYNLVIFLIVMVALAVRLIGVYWGIPNKFLHFPFHPDEQMSVAILSQIHPVEGDFNPEEAHTEGTFYYYVLIVILSFLRLAHLVSTYPWNAVFHYPVKSYVDVLLVGRLFTIFCSMLSLFITYRILKNLKLSKHSILISVAIFAVYPIDVIYSHYMRPHIMANTLLLLGIYCLTSKKITKEYLKYLLSGFLFGLSTATRYNIAVSIVIPFLYIVFTSFSGGFNAKKIFFNKNYILVVVGFIFGLFIGDPPLFLSFPEVKMYLEYQSTFIEKEEFSLLNLFNFKRIFDYLKYLIPESSQPFLWIPIYLSFFFALFKRKNLKIAVILLIYVVAFLYFMSKGYALPIFARATLPLVPAIIILIAISVDNILSILKSKKIKLGIVLMLVIVTASSLFFDSVYVYKMAYRKDPRVQFYEYITTSDVNNIYSIGEYLCDYYVQGTLFSKAAEYNFLTVEADKVSPDLLSDTNSVLVLCINGKRDFSNYDKITADGTYSITEFKNDDRFGIIDKNLPEDMLYPFPNIYILRSNIY